MACVNFTGFESGNVGEARSNSGTVSYSTSTVRTGTYSLRVNPTTSASGSYRIGLNGTDGRPTAEMNKASLYTSFYFRIATAPASNEEKIIEFADTGGSTKSYFTLTSGRVFKYYNNAGTLIATGTTALSTNTWYLIHIQTSTGSGNQAYELKINGTSELSGTANQLTNNHGSIYIGKRDNLNSQSIDLFYDDVYIDDAAFVTGIEIKRLAPIANGSTAAQWTAGTGASDYTQIDEVVPDAADYIKSGTTANHAHYFDLASCATAGVSGTIKAVKALALVREDSSVTSADQVRFKSGATTTNTSSFNHSTTAVYVAKIEENDPNTAAAWTTTNLDALEIGVFEVNAVSMRCEFMSGYVAYIPSSGSAIAVDGTTAAVSSTTGVCQVARKVTSTVAAIASVSGALSVSRQISSTVNSTSTTTATLSKAITIASNINADSSLTANCIIIKAVASSFSASSSITGSILVDRKTASVVSSASSLTGSISVLRNISSAISGVSATTAELKRTTLFSSSVESASVLTATSSVAKNLQSQINSNSDFNSTLSRQRLIASQINSTSSISGQVSVIKKLSGVIQAESSFSAAFDNSFLSIIGAVNQTSQITAELSRIIQISGVISSASSIVVVPKVTRGLSSQISANSATSAILSRSFGLSGSLSSIASCEAVLRRLFSISSAVNSSSSVVCLISLHRRISGVIIQTTDFNGTILLFRIVAGQVAGSSGFNSALSIQALASFPLKVQKAGTRNFVLKGSATAVSYEADQRNDLPTSLKSFVIESNYSEPIKKSTDR